MGMGNIPPLSLGRSPEEMAEKADPLSWRAGVSVALIDTTNSVMPHPPVQVD